MVDGVRELSRDEEVTSPRVQDSFGAIHYLLDPLIPDWVFRWDCQITRAVQAPLRLSQNNKGWLLLHWLCLAVSFITNEVFSIELTVSMILFSALIGKPQLMVFQFTWYLVLCFAGQLPKRLFFRNRPWRKRAAIKVTMDQASSFPSRSTLFSQVSVFTSLMLLGYDLWIGITVGLICCLFITYSRIYLGAHYFSDCLIGFLVAWVLNLLCYWTYEGTLLPNSFKPQGLQHMFLIYAVTIFMVVLCCVHPIYFWNKGSACLGGIAGPYLGWLWRAFSSDLVYQSFKSTSPVQISFTLAWYWALLCLIGLQGLCLYGIFVASKWGKTKTTLMVANLVVFHVVGAVGFLMTSILIK